MSAFTDAVEANTEGLQHISTGLCGQCEECQYRYGLDEEGLTEQIENGEAFDEGGFSWHRCESCGSSLGGDRYAAHGFNENEEIVHLDVCVDCVMYHANGDEPEDWRD
jgi:hypothetical protein